MSNIVIPFNKPFFVGKETIYIKEAVESGKISGDGMFTKKCHRYFEERYGFQKCLLTTSCSDALEMAAILINIVEGDEVIMPAYTFVSTPNAFVLRGAKIVFCDSRKDHPGIDEDSVESLITFKTKAIVPVHYAGVACDMAKIMALAKKYNLYLIEDAAQAIDGYYTFPNGEVKPLGSIGHLAAFSFHETKNIISGEGGMLVINDKKFIERAEVIREKGTNRARFFRGEVDKYGWVDIGGSFLPSDIIAAYLYAQLEYLDVIQYRRKTIWNTYHSAFLALHNKGKLQLPLIPDYATNNAHMYYFVCNSVDERTAVIEALKAQGIMAVSHYLSLHKSEYFKLKHDKRILPNSCEYSNCLVRLPFYFELPDSTIQQIVKIIHGVFEK